MVECGESATDYFLQNTVWLHDNGEGYMYFFPYFLDMPKENFRSIRCSIRPYIIETSYDNSKFDELTLSTILRIPPRLIALHELTKSQLQS
jgi:hypothetical protein